jgi:predicted glycogen debranching enzyme
MEDLVAPGVFACDLGTHGSATLLLGAVIDPASPLPVPPDAELIAVLTDLCAQEQRRRTAFPELLLRSGDAYLVRGERGATVIAGYPWFTDWGRDTFISLRGLCLATGRLEEAREILLHWSAAVSEGMLPNRFPDGGEAPEYNTVDAALWFVVVAHEYLRLAPEPADDAATARNAQDAQQLLATCEAILSGYAAGTRYGIHLDEADGLLAAGEPGIALTWMDARVDGRPITPRIGKPVEIQALWLNALALLAPKSTRWQTLYEKGRAQFQAKFWNAARGCLYDVIDCHGQPGRVDGSLRPNQIFAVGGLPLVLLDDDRARAVVECVERALLTPMGLRSLAASEPGYAPHYGGGPAERDGAYHQGTVWPWLLGPFVEAWVRMRGETPAAKAEAREKYLDPLVALLPSSAGLNHLPEIADAEPPHAPRGCPFQAWSLGEISRLAHGVLNDDLR